MPRWRKILYSLLTAGAVAACVWLVLFIVQRPDTCHDGVERIDGECIGVNGDGYDFGTHEISKVAEAIAAENRTVEGKKDEPYVTVALMLPLQSDSKALRQLMRSDLQGAYLAQRKENAAPGEPPNIRLVLANPGREYKHQDKIVDTLVEMAHSDEDKLRAVTGLNSSLDDSRAAVERLTSKKVPVLASRITADTIANKDSTAEPFRGLARIVPTNNDAVKALAGFNKQHGRKDRKTVVVYDTRPHDSYNASLKKAFSAINEPGSPQDLPFTSPGIDKLGSVGNKFTQIAQSICGDGADTVYFAGRALHLKTFVRKLAQESCADRDYTVISGSDAASLLEVMTEEDWKQLRGEHGKAKVTVQYAAPGHPDAWKNGLSDWRKSRTDQHRPPTKEEEPQYLREPQDALDTLKEWIDRERAKIGPTNLEDSRTMLVYDGLVTIAKALHLTQLGSTEKVPSLEDVVEEWPLIRHPNTVEGTSGLICLTNGGNSYDKPVAVVELDPGTKGRGKLNFVGLGWPTGQEQQKNCFIPNGR